MDNQLQRRGFLGSLLAMLVLPWWPCPKPPQTLLVKKPLKLRITDIKCGVITEVAATPEDVLEFEKWLESLDRHLAMCGVRTNRIRVIRVTPPDSWRGKPTIYDYKFGGRDGSHS